MGLCGDIEVYDLDSMADTITALLAGAGNVKVPVVDAQHRCGGERTVVEAPDVVIAEGCYLLMHRRLVELAGVKIFVDCDADVRLARKGMSFPPPPFPREVEEGCVDGVGVLMG